MQQICTRRMFQHLAVPLCNCHPWQSDRRCSADVGVRSVALIMLGPRECLHYTLCPTTILGIHTTHRSLAAPSYINLELKEAGVTVWGVACTLAVLCCLFVSTEAEEGCA